MIQKTFKNCVSLSPCVEEPNSEVKKLINIRTWTTVSSPVNVSCIFPVFKFVHLPLDWDIIVIMIWLWLWLWVYNTNTLGEKCEILCFLKYGLSSFTAILLQGWLWHYITHEGWYVQKQTFISFPSFIRSGRVLPPKNIQLWHNFLSESLNFWNNLRS